jgi:precorrin-6A/cobalt-precorrin-6A reductase
MDVSGTGAVLIVGGTSEARQLADALHAAGIPVVTALAGRTHDPGPLAGTVRTGGFGGTEGLAAWLRAHLTPAVVDASHPFAAQMSDAVAAACNTTGTPLLRLERPPWTEQPGDRWHRVGTLAEAAALVPALGRRVWLTIGRQGVGHFAGVGGCWFLIRCIEAPALPLPDHHALLLARGPYVLADELALIDRHRIEVLVTKDSGGAPTEAKLEAARQRHLPVVVVGRPASTGTDASTASDVEQVAAWVTARIRPSLR